MDPAREECLELRQALSLGVRCAARLLQAGANPNLEADVMTMVRAIADEELTIVDEEPGTEYGADQVARVIAAARRQEKGLARRILGRDVLEQVRSQAAGG